MIAVVLCLRNEYAAAVVIEVCIEVPPQLWYNSAALALVGTRYEYLYLKPVPLACLNPDYCGEPLYSLIPR